MPDPGAPYRIGPFVADPSSYRLLKGETAVPLSPKALDLLLLFAGRPATLFTKDDILKALWPDVAVTDNALTQVVSELRQALGDNPASPQFIETVPRRGYRFIGPVERAAAGAGGDALAGPPAAARKGPRTVAVMDFGNMTGDPDLAWLATGIAETVTNDLRTIGELRVLDRALLADAAGRPGGGGPRPDGLDLVVLGSYQRVRGSIARAVIRIRSPTRW
jgi:DNA-binding winged helix-turn-helix (wHTH) protein